jgi:hypothetical protein
VPKLALFAKPKPARQYHLARRGTARSLQFAQPGTPTFPRSCSLPSGATFFAHHVMPRGRGWTNQEYAYLAQALMETSENPILGTDQTSQAFKVGLYKFFTAQNTLYKDRDSRAEWHICYCGCPRWSSSKFATNFSATICGAICGPFANCTNVELPTRYAPRGRNLRKYGVAEEMLIEHRHRGAVFF